MKQPSSLDEETVRHQFDRKCKLALKGELVDYTRHMDYLGKHEVIFSELTERELESLSVIDEYDSEYFDFRALGYDIRLKDMLLAEALNALTERKRDVIMLSYFQGLSDADIARKLNLDIWTRLPIPVFSRAAYAILLTFLSLAIIFLHSVGLLLFRILSALSNPIPIIQIPGFNSHLPHWVPVLLNRFNRIHNIHF